MNEIISNFQSPAWWLTAVVLAIVVNLLSAYIKPLMDRGISRISTGGQRWVERSHAAYERRVERVLRDPNGVVMATLDEFRFLLAAQLCLVLVIMALVWFPMEAAVSAGNLGPAKYGVLVLMVLATVCTLILFSHSRFVADLRRRQREAPPPNQDL